MGSKNLLQLSSNNSDPSFCVEILQGICCKIDAMVSDSLIDSGMTILEVTKMLDNVFKSIVQNYKVLQQAYSQFDDISFIESTFSPVLDASIELSLRLADIVFQARDNGLQETLGIEEAGKLAMTWSSIERSIVRLSSSVKGAENALSGTFGEYLRGLLSSQPARRRKIAKLDVEPLDIEGSADSSVNLQDITDDELSNLGVPSGSLTGEL